jgi:hypothetical protein
MHQSIEASLLRPRDVRLRQKFDRYAKGIGDCLDYLVV